MVLSTPIVVFIDVSVLGSASQSQTSRTGIYTYILNILSTLRLKSEIKLLPFVSESNIDFDSAICCCADLQLNTDILRCQRGGLVDLASKISTWLNLRLFSVKKRLNHSYLSPFFVLIVLVSSFLLSLPLLLKTSWIINRRSRLHQPKVSVIHYPHFPSRIISFLTQRCSRRFITVHDMIPLLNKEYFTKAQVWSFKHRLLNAVSSRDYIFAVSNSTAKDFLDHFGPTYAKKIVVTPLAADPHRFRPTASLNQDVDLSNALKLVIQGKYFLSLGTVEPRKNISRLIKAFANSSVPSDFRLVIVGAKGWEKSDLPGLCNLYGISERVYFAGYLHDVLLPYLYTNAIAFVYPSLYEGFGLPVLEAMSCGCPVVTSNNSSLSEIVADAGLLVNPFDENSISNALYSLALDAVMRESLSASSLKRAACFSWSNTSDLMVSAYRKASISN